MFDFALLGVLLSLSGGVIVLGLRRRLLPKRASLDLQTRRGVALEYMTEIEIREGSALFGRSLGEVAEENLLGPGLSVLEVVRGEVIRAPRKNLRLAEHDSLLVFVGLAVSGVVPVEVAALLAALLAVLTGCLTTRNAYESIG